MNCTECGFRLWSEQSIGLGICAGCREETPAPDLVLDLEERLDAALETKQEELL